MGDVARGIKSFKKNMNDDESMEAHETHAPAARSRRPIFRRGGVTQKSAADVREGVPHNS